MVYRGTLIDLCKGVTLATLSRLEIYLRPILKSLCIKKEMNDVTSIHAFHSAAFVCNTQDQINFDYLCVNQQG